MATWILLSLLGTMSGHHFCHHAHSLRVISSQTLERLRFFIAPFVVCLAFWASKEVFRSAILLIVLLISPPIVMWMNGRHRRKRFTSLHLPFIDELLLKMRSGSSLRESLRSTVDQKIFANCPDLSELPSLLMMKSEKSDAHLLPEAQELLQELMKWDQSQVKTIEKLQSHRFHVRQSEKFRQKSRQVTEQVKSQALVCSFLYMSLLVWTALREPADLSTAPVVASVVLFLLGILTLIGLGRSFKWKN